MKTFKVTQEIRKILSGYKKKRIFLDSISNPAETPLNISSYWSGGSRSLYFVYNYSTGKTHIPKQREEAPTKYVGYTYILQPHEILIETGIFCGKTAIAHFTFIEDEREEVFKALGNPIEEIK